MGLSRPGPPGCASPADHGGGSNLGGGARGSAWALRWGWCLAGVPGRVQGPGGPTRLAQAGLSSGTWGLGTPGAGDGLGKEKKPGFKAEVRGVSGSGVSPPGPRPPRCGHLSPRALPDCPIVSPTGLASHLRLSVRPPGGLDLDTSLFLHLFQRQNHIPTPAGPRGKENPCESGGFRPGLEPGGRPRGTRAPQKQNPAGPWAEPAGPLVGTPGYGYLCGSSAYSYPRVPFLVPPGWLGPGGRAQSCPRGSFRLVLAGRWGVRGCFGRTCALGA